MIDEALLNKYNFTHKNEVTQQPSFVFAQKIVEMHPYGFCGGTVYGPRRIGKSIYSLKVMKEVFEAYGCSEEEAWDLAFHSMYFNPADLLVSLNLLVKRREVWPVVCLDDAAVGAGSHIWFTNRQMYYALNAVMNTVGTVVSGFILTTPNFEKMLDTFRDAEDIYRIEIVRLGEGWPRKASAYMIKILPSGTMRIRSKRDPRSGFVDEFSAYLVNDKYRRYANMRWPYTLQATKEALDKLKTAPKIPKGRREELRALKGEIESVLKEGEAKAEKTEDASS